MNEWFKSHWESWVAFVGTGMFGLFLWGARKGGAEAFKTIENVRMHEARLRAIERSLENREHLCTDHRDELGKIQEMIAELQLKTLDAIGAIGQRVSKLEGIDKGQHRVGFGFRGRRVTDVDTESAP